MSFYERLKEGQELGKVVQVLWYIRGEDAYFKPESCAVILKDENGKEMKIRLPSYVFPNDVECSGVLLNCLFAMKGLIPDGMWIGVNCDTSEMVNAVRKKLNNPSFQSNEKECRKNGFLTPEYIFS